MADTIDYKAVLADLKAKRAKYDAMIGAMESFIALDDGLTALETTLSAGVSSIQPDSFVGLNIAEAASKFLRLTGKPAKSTEQIAESLNRGGLKCTQSSVSAILRRNYNSGEGDVIKVGRGLWGLQEWYPGRPRRSRQASENSE